MTSNNTLTPWQRFISLLKLEKKDIFTDNISNEKAKIQLETGTYKERFYLVFKESSVLSINEDEILNSFTIKHNRKEKLLSIQNNGNSSVEKVTVYSLLGQKILEIVPDNALTANVYLTNRDRGFVKEGMEVDVRVDSFDYSEFGDIQGKLISIGADALEPDQNHPYYRFPAQIELEQQFIKVKGQEVPLTSGMSVSANIKERKRKVINILFNSLAKKFDNLEKAK